MHATKAQTTEALAKTFPALRPLICEEWPEVDAKALEATEGDYEKVVALVTSSTEHSKTLVRRHLAEIVQVANEDAANRAARGSGKGGGALGAARRNVEDALRKLHETASEGADRVRKRALIVTKHEVQRHPLVALLMAIGLGFIFGFWLRGLGCDRDAPSA